MKRRENSDPDELNAQQMPKNPLFREIGAALVFKLLALLLLYFAFFSSSHKTHVTPSEMAAFLRDNHSASQ